MEIKNNYKKYLFYLIAISTLVRLALAAAYPLTNDEAYYYIYAKNPAWSHFDHPGMVGWIIQLFTFNLLLNAEWAIRLAAIFATSFNTWLIFKIGNYIGNPKAGWYSALLYNLSFYGFIIAGTLILPDAPQSMFWFLALLFVVKAFFVENELKKQNINFVTAFIFIGLGMLSKYSTVFLWAGIFGFILFNDRKWLKRSGFYFANIIALASLLPIIIWNYQHDFISFTFHSNRIELSKMPICWQCFFTELGGEILYTNPLVWILIVVSLVLIFRKKYLKKNIALKLFLWSGLPVIITFLAISLFRSTLPHWSGLGYMSLIIIAAYVSAENKFGVQLIKFSAVFLVLLLVLLPVFINTNLLKPKNDNIGKDDFSLDLYGWTTCQKEFQNIAKKYESESENEMLRNSPVIASRWFPAANIEYYLRKDKERKIYCIGDTVDIHEYIWINKKNGELKPGSNAYYITSSRDFRPPTDTRVLSYETPFPPDTIKVYRCEKEVYSFYIYRLYGIDYK